VAGEPYRFANRPAVLRCRKCREDTGLRTGTVMARSREPLSVWFWAAYLVASQTPGMSARQFQRQLGISRYETAFNILHKLRAAMVRPNRDRIGGNAGPNEYVEVDETYVGGRTRGRGRGVTDQVVVAGAVEVRWTKKSAKSNRQRYGGRVRLAVADRNGKTLCRFIQGAVEPGAVIITDGWEGYNDLPDLGYQHSPVDIKGQHQVADLYLKIIHLVFSNLKAWLNGTHHSVSPKHLQAYLNEFTFRFNRRFTPLNAFRSLLGIATEGVAAPTYDGLYSGNWRHPRCW